MLDQQHKLIPGEALIYERADGVTYAKYRDPPHNKIPRWIVGGDPGGLSRAQGVLLHYGEWQNLCDMCKKNETLNKLMDKLIITYFMLKDSEND